MAATDSFLRMHDNKKTTKISLCRFNTSVPPYYSHTLQNIML
ncbi:hypothetical protein BRYFOR_06149 [Marvinbryantia formatexigens DSM 14469]|uniref:Uncharacterized protein n=1 Tax=Marvinbryantia formatexigens DSM 14469 TaxID=478749 RepID=C6LC01_9FIRM|nr:hypothetical protein BRYFOR_06149 [Marvinbryantia formatexigens DSM 14469]